MDHKIQHPPSMLCSPHMPTDQLSNFILTISSLRQGIYISEY